MPFVAQSNLRNHISLISPYSSFTGGIAAESVFVRLHLLTMAPAAARPWTPQEDEVVRQLVRTYRSGEKHRIAEQRRIASVASFRVGSVEQLQAAPCALAIQRE